jgi:hypothetical protein
MAKKTSLVFAFMELTFWNSNKKTGFCELAEWMAGRAEV